MAAKGDGAAMTSGGWLSGGRKKMWPINSGPMSSAWVLLVSWAAITLTMPTWLSSGSSSLATVMASETSHEDDARILDAFRNLNNLIGSDLRRFHSKAEVHQKISGGRVGGDGEETPPPTSAGTDSGNNYSAPLPSQEDRASQERNMTISSSIRRTVSSWKRKLHSDYEAVDKLLYSIWKDYEDLVIVTGIKNISHRLYLEARFANSREDIGAFEKCLYNSDDPNFQYAAKLYFLHYMNGDFATAYDLYKNIIVVARSVCLLPLLTIVP